MKYVSLDLETTSLIPAFENILQLSMVVEDTTKRDVPVEKLPHFTCFVDPGEIKGQSYALAMNGWILDIISGRVVPSTPPLIYRDDKLYLITDIRIFLNEHFGNSKVTVAGKNVAGFDMQFLPPVLKALFRHSVLDPGSLCVDWATDKQVPNFTECKRRCGIETPVAHDAYEDALDVIRCLRKFY